MKSLRFTSDEPDYPSHGPVRCRHEHLPIDSIAFETSPVIARLYRLREEADVRRVRSLGKGYAHGPLVARVLPNELEPAQNRYTVIAGKKSGNAVQRNRLKRLTREALRGFHPHLRPGHDIAIIVRGDVTELPTLTRAQTVLERIFTMASLFAPSSDSPLPRPGDAVLGGWHRPRKASPLAEEPE